MTVLSRGARVRRGGRRPGWVLLTTLLVLAIAASSALVFTNRVELLKLAVILALWAAVAGAFVSVLYRRQADAEQARARDLKLVYDLQLDREIAARREYELTVESQLRRELAIELRGAAADEVAALRAELTALRTSLEILFDTDFEHRPALEPMDKTGTTEARRSRAVADRVQNGQSPAADWVSIDRVAVVRPGDAVNRAEEAIIDVPEVGMPPYDDRDVPPAGPLPPPAEPMPAGQKHSAERVGPRYENYETAPERPGQRYEPRHRPPPPPAPPPQPEPSSWEPVAADGQWLPPGAPGGHWASAEPTAAPPAQPSGRRRRYRHSGPQEDQADVRLGHVEVPADYGGRRSRPRHSTEYRDHGVGSLGAVPRADGPGLGAPSPAAVPPPPPAPAPPPPPARPTGPPPPAWPRRRFRNRRRAIAARSQSPTARREHMAPTRRPVVNRSPTCWPGCRSSRREVGGVAAAAADRLQF
ncbi:putative conserved transmembrane protein rich in alanine, arginine and proline [Mycobacterium kansasii 732]|nr:putative conserved transmembrane protein rich in alanine, arginine and proline [Mycobacterium kansasii 732]